ncbi:PREDICTED: uncharacterized protein LOC104811179 isoform X2 [Tarenaya hassleriana]|nr:PREDICTED: uncharacterized protein LOC104811179 isoform X2 [Tarenaya hassleriana]
MQFAEENSQPNWVEFMPQETEQSVASKIKSGVISRDARKAYFCTKDGMLLELIDAETPRWMNHGRPPGADVAAIADVANIKDMIFTVSSTGVLYQYCRNSKPPWKKHLRKQDKADDTSLAPLLGCAIHGIVGDHSVSLFLLTKGGDLVERRLHQRKWKWIIHGRPPGNNRFTSIARVLQDEQNEVLSSGLFLSTSSGLVFEYQMLKHEGSPRRNEVTDAWINHMHPENAKVARGIAGLPLQAGRIVFPLDDGRLGELHLSGQGGEHLGPNDPSNTKRKPSAKYVWTTLDAPESEGWNAEYCVEERGSSNCMIGIKDESTRTAVSRRRKGSQVQEYYLPRAASDVGKQTKTSETSAPPGKTANSQYRLRMTHQGRSFFLVTDNGLTFEYINAENVWFWMKHEHSTPMKGVLGNYNGSLFLVDAHGSLLIRERCGQELVWVNCTSFRKGKQVTGGPPWDVMPGKGAKLTAEDALFFVGKSGKLLQLTVGSRRFKWKDCKHPRDTKIAAIADQELFRKNIVFAIGSNGRLYQYNKVTELWHEHYQSKHLVLSHQPGIATRPTPQSLKGSLFMVSEEGGLVEYNWNDGWDWIEHGKPSKSVTIVSPPGPWFEGDQLLLIGSDGNVYLRYMDETTWRWKRCRFPNSNSGNHERARGRYGEEICVDISFRESSLKNAEDQSNANKNCDTKVSPTRPILLTENSAIFELQDGRLAEMKRMENKIWVWSRIISTPTSLCDDTYWIAFASEN